MSEPGFDYDWIVVGSGFGGSVSALRLAEKGYSVCVLECGRRFADEDFAETTWQSRRYFWRKLLGRGVTLQTQQDPERPNPAYIPVAEQASRWWAKRTATSPSCRHRAAAWRASWSACRSRR